LFWERSVTKITEDKYIFIRLLTIIVKVLKNVLVVKFRSYNFINFGLFFVGASSSGHWPAIYGQTIS